MKLERAMDRYESAAQAAGFQVRADISSFDERQATDEFKARDIWLNEELFAFWRRWNGVHLFKETEFDLAIGFRS
ncbi:MAG: hypothetical protein AAF869_08200, partial [Pseudomonadota bacterium]